MLAILSIRWLLASFAVLLSLAYAVHACEETLIGYCHAGHDCSSTEAIPIKTNTSLHKDITVPCYSFYAIWSEGGYLCHSTDCGQCVPLLGAMCTVGGQFVQYCPSGF